MHTCESTVEPILIRLSLGNLIAALIAVYINDTFWDLGDFIMRQYPVT